MDPILRLNRVEVSYMGFSLGPLDLEIPRGAVVGLIGESGSGKTTCIKTILGLKKPDSGQVEVLGEAMDPNTFSQYGRMGIVFDSLYMPDSYYIYEVEDLCRDLYKEWDGEVFSQYCRDLSLDKNKRVEELSKGMKMKLAFAMALSHKADLLILDEPTSGLDPGSREEFLDLILNFMQDPAHSVLISSHILSDLDKVADYVAFIHEGEILFMEDKFSLGERYGIWKGSEEEFERIKGDHFIRYRTNDFGVEALVLKEKCQEGLELERPSVEEIMVFYLRGK